MKRVSYFLTLTIFFIFGGHATLSQTPQPNPVWLELDGLPRGMTEEEELRRHEIGQDFVRSAAPEGLARNIAEWERNEAVVIRYPLGIPIELVGLMSEHVRVITLVANFNQQNEARESYENAGAYMENIEFIYAATNSMWTRDYGPFYIATENQEVAIVDFIYNRPRPLDNAVSSVLADYFDMPLYAMDLVHTGGNYMGTGLETAASTDLIWEENNHNNAFVMERMYDYMGIETYFTTIDPLDPNGIKHIDTWAKFVDVDKIIVAEVPQSDPRYDDYEEVAAYFEAQVSPWGTPYQVYRVYSPQGQPYTNSLILNERVYVPITDSPADAAALQVFQEAMPGYEIMGVTATWWATHDALHCRTKEIADSGMLSIQHIPVIETPPSGEAFEIYADIIPYSGADLIEDELFLIYSSNDAPFDTLALNHIDGNTFSASIPHSTEKREITYYFSAADESGRKETWPLVGLGGARTFTLPGYVSNEEEPFTEALRIEALYPNPTTGSITARYTLDAPATVQVEIFDVMGRQVMTLDQGSQSAGVHSHTLNAGQLAGGVYVYRLTAGNVRLSERFVVTR